MPTCMPRSDSIHQHGFTLIEIMVAVVIGLFGVMAMTQMYIQAENNKKTSTNSGDAMIEGMVAMTELQRDIRMAGYGVANKLVLGCNFQFTYNDASGSPITRTINRLGSVTINHENIPAGDNNTDTLLIFYADTRGFPSEDSSTPASTALQYTVGAIHQYRVGDYVVIAPDIPECNNATTRQLAQVTNLTQVSSSITINAGNFSNRNTIFNLGAAFPTIVVYAIRNGKLTRCNYLLNDCGLASNTSKANVWESVANNIVSMRAQYAQRVPNPAGGTTLNYQQNAYTTACDWLKTPVIRVGILARNPQPEKDATSTVPTWSGSSGDAPFLLSGDWKNYRYNVQESMINMRNMAWLTPTSTGC